MVSRSQELARLQEPTRRAAPATSAAPASCALTDGDSLVRLGKDLALDLEGQRRSITLGGSLLWIPAAACISLAVSASFGLTGVWLLVAAFAGLAAGPALTTASMATLSLFGLPTVRARFFTRARALGLSPEQAEEAWRLAASELDAEVRGRLGRPRPAPSAPLEEFR